MLDWLRDHKLNLDDAQGTGPTAGGLDGALKSQCQIWIDNNFGKYPNIKFFDGRDFFYDYNARDDILSIIETEEVLKLKASMGSFSGDRIEAYSPDQAGEVLWFRFVKTILM